MSLLTCMDKLPCDESRDFVEILLENFDYKYYTYILLFLLNQFEEFDRRISNASLFIGLLLLRRHFFLSSIRGNDIYISGFASSVCERTFRGIGP